MTLWNQKKKWVAWKENKFIRNTFFFNTVMVFFIFNFSYEVLNLQNSNPLLLFLPGKSNGQKSLWLQSKESKRVRHDWVTKHTYTCLVWIRPLFQEGPCIHTMITRSKEIYMPFIYEFTACLQDAHWNETVPWLHFGPAFSTFLFQELQR